MTIAIAEGLMNGGKPDEYIKSMKRFGRLYPETGVSKNDIKSYIEYCCKNNLSRTLDAIRPGYIFDVSCQGTVPEAIISYLESENFEDAIRNAVSLGGDSDTLAAITGSIAEAAYGVPDNIKDRAIAILDDPL